MLEAKLTLNPVRENDCVKFEEFLCNFTDKARLMVTLTKLNRHDKNVQGLQGQKQSIRKQRLEIRKGRQRQTRLGSFCFIDNTTKTMSLNGAGLCEADERVDGMESGGRA